jgi:hypothetical protein
VQVLPAPNQAGLRKGDRLIVSGQRLVSDGQRIVERPVPALETKSSALTDNDPATAGVAKE